MKVRLLMAAPLLAVLLPAASQAQVTVDVAKITCKPVPARHGGADQVGGGFG